MASRATDTDDSSIAIPYLELQGFTAWPRSLSHFHCCSSAVVAALRSRHLTPFSRTLPLFLIMLEHFQLLIESQSHAQQTNDTSDKPAAVVSSEKIANALSSGSATSSTFSMRCQASSKQVDQQSIPCHVSFPQMGGIEEQLPCKLAVHSRQALSQTPPCVR